MSLELVEIVADIVEKFLRYFYRLLSGLEPLSSFEKDRAWHVPEELDVRAMQVWYLKLEFSWYDSSMSYSLDEIAKS